MTMRPIRGVMLLAGLFAFATTTVRAADVKTDVKVIANPSVTASSISAGDLKDVFLENKTAIDGVAVEPVLGKHGDAHEAFLKEYLGKTDSALSTYYRSLVFTGKAPMPKALDSDAEVAAYVARTKGAIGYVSASASAPGTKTLDVK
jgi:hypothetical protein